MTNSRKIIAISDVHLGHRKTSTEGIINNLKTVLNPNRLSDTDILIIAGDLFDHAIGFSDEDTLLIQRWSILLLSLCSTYNVTLRVLEGTPLHDRGQSKHLEVFNSAAKFNVDFLYVDKVYIEKNEKHSLNILYVPDEWHPDPDETWIDVKQILAENNLDSVDISVMHGMFEHQLPPMCPIKPHINHRYENITDKYIFIGHIHQPTVKGKIIAPGSFDRLSHGDEGKKGCWEVVVKDDKSLDTITFLENVNAKTYLTIDCTGLGFDSAIEKISTLDIKEDSHVRIRATKGDNALAILEWCKKNFFNYRWTLQVINDDKSSSKEKPMLIKRTETFTITPNSITSLMNKKMIDNGVDEGVLNHALKLSEEIF